MRVKAGTNLTYFGDDAMSTSTSDFQSLAARVDKLERQNRWLKRTALALLILPAYLAVTRTGQAQPSARTLEAQNFVLRDSSGKVRAELLIFADNPHLEFFGARGKARLNLFLLNSGPALTFNDENGEERMGLGTENFTFRQAGNFLKGEDGRVRAELGVTDEGGAAFHLYDLNGKDRVAMGVPPKLGPFFSLTDVDSKAYFVAFLDPSKGAKLGLRDASGKSTFTLTGAGPGG